MLEDEATYFCDYWVCQENKKHFGTTLYMLLAHDFGMKKEVSN
jgi:hypothetical protein